jgi:hypothetical protein
MPSGMIGWKKAIDLSFLKVYLAGCQFILILQRVLVLRFFFFLFVMSELQSEIGVNW